MAVGSAKPAKSPYAAGLTSASGKRPGTGSKSVVKMTRSASTSSVPPRALPMQAARQGQSFGKASRFSSKLPKSKHAAVPGPGSYDYNPDSVRSYVAPALTMSKRWDGGSQVVSGIGFMGKEHRPGDITPGPGAYGGNILKPRSRAIGKEKRFRRMMYARATRKEASSDGAQNASHALTRPTTRHETPPPSFNTHHYRGDNENLGPGPAAYVTSPPQMGSRKIGTGGTLHSSMSSPSIKLHAKAPRAGRKETPGPANYSPYNTDSLGRYAPRTVFTTSSSRTKLKPPSNTDVPGPGQYTPDDGRSARKVGMSFRTPIGKLSRKCGGGFLGGQPADPNAPGPGAYNEMHSALAKNFVPVTGPISIGR